MRDIIAGMGIIITVTIDGDTERGLRVGWEGGGVAAQYCSVLGSIA